MFRKMPFILLAIIAAIGAFGQWIPLYFQSMLYAMSLTIKSAVIFVLPFVIFGLLFKTSASIANKASTLILFLLAGICSSNFLSTWISFVVGSTAYGFDIAMSLPTEVDSLQPAWLFSLPKWIGNGEAMFAGLALGLILGSFRPQIAKKISHVLDLSVNRVLKCILMVIPLFIAGFMIKMHHDQVMTYIFRNYALIFGLIACAVFTYIAFLYLLACKFRMSRFFVSIKNMLPAAIAGFGSMSSAASMPLTILGTEKNCNHGEVARSVIPVTVNIHLIGDCFAIPIFAFAVMKSFGVEAPSFGNYLVFASFFVLAKFSVAAVPGGGVLVMLPILETYLGFKADMLSLITALYILFDPVITCANVFGNGAFAMIIDRLLYRSNEPVNKSEEPTVLERV